jgi:site-specific recombinase XerD
MDQVKEIFTNDFKDDFVAFAYAELNKERKLLAPKTYKGYNDRLNALKRYRPVIPFRSITEQFLNDYKYYVAVEEGRSPNGYYQDFATIKKFFKIGIKAGKAKVDPFENFDMDKEETSRHWLEEMELNKLHELLEAPDR